MKICICSDSHGNREGIKEVLRLENPDGFIFCGDGINDLRGVDLPEKTIIVRGNCDGISAPEPITASETWGGVRLLVTHGHRFSVKATLDSLLSEALACDAQVAIYGHTHIQKVSYMAGVMLLNGGSLKKYDEHYAVLYAQNGVFDCQLKSLSRLTDI